MSLDDKLLEIVESKDNYVSYPDGFNGVIQVKQVFQDEGYVYHAQSDSFKTTTLRMGLMSGQEWYDRFSTALVGYACLPVDVGSVDWDSGDVMRAAKEAAGLS